MSDCENSPWNMEYRLPKTVNPIHYELFLWPKIEENIFNGNLQLQFEVKEPRQFLALHERGLTIMEPKINLVSESGDLKLVEIKSSFSAPKNDFYVILPSKGAFEPGRYELDLKFSSNLQRADIVGFYASQYKDNKGAVRKLVTSKFEPTYARRAFPCFDEPDKKANFTISLVRPSEGAVMDSWISLSNMNELETVDGPGKDYKTTKFATSVKMSTYLACFIVSQFESLDPRTIASSDNLEGPSFEVKTYAQPDLVQNSLEALDAAESVVKLYITYFNLQYPLPKLDLIAIPDFVSGAMEHWGLITFRETNMIFDPAKGSALNLQRVVHVVAHEIAHMWFGNLVTMIWWDDLWLNEGFATYMEYKAGDKYKEDWQFLDQFVLDELQPVMALDSLESSHPVIQPVAHPDQITEIFDTITYSKGSSVLRMLESFLGEEVFKTGVRNYLDAYKYKNAATQDLWNKLQEAADTAEEKVDVNVTRVMNSWTLQTGMPYLQVTVNAGTASITQSRFLATPPALRKNKEDSTRWDIPIKFLSKGDTEPSPVEWFYMEDTKIQIPVTNSWIKLNANQEGFYRVNYDSDLWSTLTVAYANMEETLTPVDRSSLIDDAFSLSAGSIVDYKIAFELASALEAEKEYIPWATAYTHISKILPLIRGKVAYKNFLAFSQSIVKEIYTTSAAGWEGPAGTHIEILLQTEVISFACMAGLQECLDQASTKFTAWYPDPEANAIAVDVRSLGYNYGMQQEGTLTIWLEVSKLYLAETDPQERSKILKCLSTIQDITVLEMFLEMAWDETYVKGQDYFSVLQNVADNPTGEFLVWDHVRLTWPRLVERFTVNSRSLGRLIPYITKNFDSELRLKEMNDFFAMYPDAGAGAAGRLQAIERVQFNIYWVATKYPEIETWLNTWAEPPAEPKK